MEDWAAFLLTHGYLLLFGVGFVEFSGLPMAGAVVLVGAGAVVAEGHLGFVPAVMVTAAGALLADLGWYVGARYAGRPLLGILCGLSSNPNGCVFTVLERLRVAGSLYVVPAKFVPGAANLIAPAAGLRRIDARKFLPLDAVAVTAWSAVYIGLGWIFAEHLDVVIQGLRVYSGPAVALACLSIAVAAVWRLVKIRRHRRAHGRGDP